MDDPLATIGAALGEIENRISGQGLSPQVRKLRARCLTYGRAYREWVAAPPLTSEREIMCELVNELLEAARALPVIRRSGTPPVGAPATTPPPSEVRRAGGAGDRKAWRPPKRDTKA
jgi:hypothetical protein